MASSFCSVLTAALQNHLTEYAGFGSNMDQTVYIAYSGGADSTALLLACRQLGLPLQAVHVNHQLQSAATVMQTHCEQFCQRFSIPLIVLKVEVLVDGGESLEANARLARYRAIGDYLKQQGAGLILTAHHEDDQLETTLIHLFRGSGLEGLSGMAVCAAWPVQGEGVFSALRLGRPFLNIAGVALRRALHEWGCVEAFDWFEDPSNTDLDLRRNWLRHACIPQLEQAFPQWRDSLCRLNRQVSNYRQDVDQRVDAVWSQCIGSNRGLLLQQFNTLPSALRAQVLRAWLKRQGIRLNEAKALELLSQLYSVRGGVRQVAGTWYLLVKQGLATLQFK